MAEAARRRRAGCSSRSGSRCAASCPRMVARSPFGQGAAWPGRRDRAARRHLRRGDRPGARTCREDAGRGRPAAGAAASPPSWAWSACWRSSCSRPTGRHAAGQRAGDAPAQLRALDHRRRRHLAVRAAPAGGAGLPAGRHRADRAGGGDGQRARWRRGAGDARSTSGCTTCSRAMPDAKVHLYGKGERPGRKIGHVTVARATTSTEVRGRGPRARRALAVARRGGPTDGTHT